MSMSGGSGRTGVRIVSLAVAVVAGFGLLAGCGASDGAAPDGSGTVGNDATAGGGGGGTGTTDATGGAGGGAQTTKACQLVTSEEAAAALGGAVTNSVNDDIECFYEAGTSNLDVGFTTEAFNAETVNTLTQLPGMQKIDGVGDAAFRFSQEGQSQFHVWTKGKYLVLMIEKPSGDTATVGRALLDKALSRF